MKNFLISRNLCFALVQQNLKLILLMVKFTHAQGHTYTLAMKFCFPYANKHTFI